MGFPMILFGLGELVNASFEDDVDDPTGWDTSASMSGDQEIDSAVAHSAGTGLASTRSLRQNVATGDVSELATARQRVALSSVLEVLRATGGEVAASVCLRSAGPLGLENASVKLELYTGGTAAIGSGTLVEADVRSWRTSGPEWFLHTIASTVPSAAEWVEVALEYRVVTAGRWTADDDVWWDRVFIGGLVDLGKRPRQFRPRVDLGVAVNEGDRGAVEIVRTRNPRSELDVQWVNVLDGTLDDLAFKRLERWLESDGAGVLALWGDRDAITNAGRHYQRVVYDPELKLDYPKGILRRDYTFRFIATAEGSA